MYSSKLQSKKNLNNLIENHWFFWYNSLLTFMWGWHGID